MPSGSSPPDASPREASATTANPRRCAVGRAARLVGLDPAAARNGCNGVAWASLRFWSQRSLAALENGACDDGRPPASPPAICTNKVRSASNAARSTRGRAVSRIDRQASRSNIQAGSSASGPSSRYERNAPRPGRLLDHLMSTDDTSSPRVPRIKDLPLLSTLGPVGVPSPGCTTTSDRISDTATRAGGHGKRSNDLSDKEAKRTT